MNNNVFKTDFNNIYTQIDILKFYLLSLEHILKTFLWFSITDVIAAY